MKTHILVGLITLALAPTPTRAQTIDLANPTPIQGVTVSNGLITITEAGTFTFSGATSHNRLLVAPNLTTTLIFYNVSITSNVGAPLALSPTGCTVTLRLEGSNDLTCIAPNTSGNYFAALQVEGSTSLSIEGPGTLSASGGIGGAGIGGRMISGQSQNAGTGTIIINSGTITATGGEQAAGIGGGAECNGGNISINGGTINASGASYGAGIGGGYHGSGGNINITGGSLTATGGYMAAGIGSGAAATSAGTISISGGQITAQGAHEAAGIGGGRETPGGTIAISGGAIMAYGNNYAAAIGGGALAQAESIRITGGNVYAWGGFVSTTTAAGAGIGGGVQSGTGGNISINGGTVVADRIGLIGPAWTDKTNVTITGGVILTNSINTTAFGTAYVLTELGLTQPLIEAMANNSPITFTEMHDTTMLTLPGDTLIRHDTVRIEQHDTIWQKLLRLHDTIRIELHDTFTRWVNLQVDTLRLPQLIDDTLYIYHYLHDTLHIANPNLHDTIEQLVHDTLRLTTIERHYIVIARNPDGTLYETEALPYPHTITLNPDGSATISALAPQTTYTLYDYPGRIITRGTTDSNGRAHLPPTALSPQGYILHTSNTYWQWNYAPQ